ncbi:MAG: AbrB/MazE/SpoVT family DNA-binding domain-containing protein [Deltaproteobacteria bacterium]|nr:AbrB/MazE/SpoVT family DNA-binding domain-containing protein [Deltaproteobacteria bacterium]
MGGVTAKVTTKGQVTLPKEVRERIGIEAGDEIDFEEKKGFYILKKKPKPSPFDKWVGYLKHKKGEKPDEIVEALRGK